MGIEICRGFLNSIVTFTASANGCKKINDAPIIHQGGKSQHIVPIP